jgi:hypothetical protein
MKKQLFLLVFVTLAFSAKAHDIELNGFYFNITSLTNLTVALTCNENNFVEEYYGEKYYTGNSYSGDIVVPEEITWNGRTFVVNEILQPAFLNCTLTSLVVPPAIQYMHLGNATIQKLVIEDSEELLHASGQYGMTDGQIEELYLGRTSPSRLNAGIKKVTFGKYVTEIASYMFTGCDIQGQLVLPENITKLNFNAFAGNEGITSVKAIGLEIMKQQSFSDCSNLKTIDAPNLKYIGSGAFENCTSLTAYEIPQGVATVGAVAFDGCTNLESVTIPNSIINFGSEVYYNVTYYQVFRGCSALKTINVNATVPFVLEESNFDAKTYINATLNVPSSSLEAYKNANVWKNFFNISGDIDIEDNVCSVMIMGCNDSYNGFVEIGDLQIKDYEYIMSANKGDKITLKFFPNSDEYESYELGKVTIDGKDVTSDVINNELTIVVTSNMTIDIDWDYAESNPILLTIKQAENGCTKMVVDKWETYKFYIEPTEGWSIHSVTFNGGDITNRVGDDGSLKLSEISENSILSITFESNSSSVKGLDVNRARIYATDNSIVITGANKGERIQIYDDAGMLVKNAEITVETMRISLPSGIYIIKLEGKTVKVAI